MLYLPIVILLAAVLVLIYLIFRPDQDGEINNSKTFLNPFVESCHICKKTHVRMDDYQLNGSPVKVCGMCKEYAERRAYFKVR